MKGWAGFTALWCGVVMIDGLSNQAAVGFSVSDMTKEMLKNGDKCEPTEWFMFVDKQWNCFVKEPLVSTKKHWFMLSIELVFPPSDMQGGKRVD